MAGKVRYLVNRSGRYHARVVVPKRLRSFFNDKLELRTPLGGDYRQALKLLPGAVANHQREIAIAERKLAQQTGRNIAPDPRYILTPQQIAFSHYTQRLAFDDELRNDRRYASVGIDDLLVSRLLNAVAGRADDAELSELVGYQVERFRAAGNLAAEIGSDEWRVIARALCSAELEALERVCERDEGDFTGTPSAPIIRDAQPPQDAPKKVKLSKLWTDYIKSRVQAGFMRDNGKRLNSVQESLRKFLKHDDASRVTKKDLIAWREHLMESLSAKTVNDIYLSAVRSLFAWAAENDILSENVAASVRQPKPRKVYGRERGYTDAEAVKVLKASRTYQSKADEFGNVREGEQTANMKRWVPIICAFSGARVSEITQLRKEDVRKEGEVWVMRITPDAGTVKAGGYRDVPLHPQIVKEGFLTFVDEAEDGPLFHNATEPEKFKRAAEIVSNKLSDWLRESGLTPKGLQPNHAWRHRLKTQCRELGLSDRVADAIQGHAGKTAGDNYGDVTLSTKAKAINQLPEYDLT
jgi:integrase